MATISWLTPSGSLGTITEKEYFEFQFDAVNSAGHPINYMFIAGQLAAGFAISSTGLLYGIPVMDITPITTESFTQIFTIRASDSTNNTVISDRTFNITLNPVALPQIYPLNVTLGTFSDATYIDLQLLATDPDPLIPVIWMLVDGQLPLGTTLTSDGRLYGFILPTVTSAYSSLLYWDVAPWDANAWDLNAPEAAIKNYIFTVEIFDGSRTDKTTFSIVVTASTHYTADSTQWSIDNDNKLIVTADREPSLHSPYISTQPQFLPVQRELENFAFKVNGVDLDNNVLNYELISPTNFTANYAAPNSPAVLDQWWDLTNNQIMICAAPAEITEAGAFTIGSSYTIQSFGVGRSTTFFTSSPTITPTSILNIPTGGYSITINVDGNVAITSNIAVSNTDTLTDIALSIQSAPCSAGAVVSADNNALLITSTSNWANSSVFVTEPSELLTAIDTAISGGSTTSTVIGTNFMSIGAANNTIGTEFIATGAGTGTGTASLIPWQVMIPTSDLTAVDTNILPIISANVGPGVTSPTIDINTGWITGTLGDSLHTQQQTYVFQAKCFKQMYPTFASLPVTFVLTVLGSQTNTITWVTPNIIGVISGGEVSELAVVAISSAGNNLTYSLVLGSLPPGLTLSDTGLIYGQVGYIDTTIDIGTTVFDNQTTYFDNTGVFNFSVRVEDIYGNYSIRNFTVDVISSIVPYENLYMRALLPQDDRLEFLSLLNNQEIFPDQLLYRKEDPWFGKAKDIKFLFAAGLNIGTAATYISDMQQDELNKPPTPVMQLNHFNKTINIGSVKTAVALDENFNIKYEVVYLEVVDPQQVIGELPPSPSMYYPDITRPGEPPGTFVYSNNLSNMKKEIVDDIGYANQGALPEWMLSTQPNGQVLGFTYGIVLAYTVPGASSLIAYRLQQNNISFNNLSFIVDRYQINQVIGSYSLPEEGDLWLKFPKIDCLGDTETPGKY